MSAGQSKVLREVLKAQREYREEEVKRHLEDLAIRIQKIGGPVGPRLAERIGLVRR